MSLVWRYWFCVKRKQQNLVSFPSVDSTPPEETCVKFLTSGIDFLFLRRRSVAGQVYGIQPKVRHKTVIQSINQCRYVSLLLKIYSEKATWIRCRRCTEVLAGISHEWWSWDVHGPERSKRPRLRTAPEDPDYSAVSQKIEPGPTYAWAKVRVWTAKNEVEIISEAWQVKSQGLKGRELGGNLEENSCIQRCQMTYHRT